MLWALCAPHPARLGGAARGVDAVATQVHLSSNISTDMLKLALRRRSTADPRHRLFGGGRSAPTISFTAVGNS
jgi:hypothetical protein